MIDVLNLALPYFGLIFLGYACGRLKQIPDTGLAWMNFFIVYVALPCLFYRIVAKTPFEELANVSFVAATSLSTTAAFFIAFGIAKLGHRTTPEATIAGLAGGYGNIGYMGPGLALSTLGPQAAAPVALIFCFDSIILFSLVPFLMEIGGGEPRGFWRSVVFVSRRIALHPFIIATLLGAVSAALHVEPPVALDRLMQFLQNAAAPCALFVLGVTVALRPLPRLAWDVPAIVPVKLLLHPLIVFFVLAWFGPFSASWTYAAVLMAALPPALNVFVLARQYDVWVEEASGSILIGTLVSVLTLTSVMWLVQSGRLPVTPF
ncbi:AEC family transporter [Pseudorhodoplanes sp.]|uniref:AEC family transporter n=1 Tax=Pseudorhodoplanes sp. TaxID=1934341 RepID=UPI003D0E7A2D